LHRVTTCGLRSHLQNPPCWTPRPRSDYLLSGIGTARGGESRPRGHPPEGVHRYWHYAFVASVFAVVFSTLALVNGFYGFVNISSYSVGHGDISSSILFAGYAGMFFAMAILPIPDYTLMPVYGFLCSIGLFNPVATFFVCLVAAVFPLEYLCGRLAARPLLLKGLRYFGITENDIEVADRWLFNHGQFSVFMATFVPYFYSVVALAAGTLKMKAVQFMVYSAVGFGLRYAFLEYIGYKGVYIFSAPFDYSQRALFAGILIFSSVYAGVHLARTRGLTTIFS
jgi:membrane protein DedA with SNARE-associated domain